MEGRRVPLANGKREAIHPAASITSGCREVCLWLDRLAVDWRWSGLVV